MVITKDVILGSLEIDPDKGCIWLNTSQCILRIYGLKFHNITEKFSMIDINGSKAFMILDGLEDTKFQKVLQDIIKHLFYETLKQGELSDDDLVPFIKKCIESYQEKK